MRPWTVLGAAVSFGVGGLTMLQLSGLSDATILLISNFFLSGAAALAFVCCVLAGRRMTGRRRAMWAWLAVGTGAWAAGQGIYNYYAAALGTVPPIPSVADLAFLTFPLAASVGVVIWLGSHGHELAARGRDVLDGAIIAGSLLVLSWVTTLGSLVDTGGSWLSLTVSMAYPVTDVALGTLVLIALVRGAPHERFTLGLLALGLGGLVISDSSYVYFLRQEAPWTADVFGVGWFFGFGFVAVAAATDVPTTDSVVADRAGESSSHDELNVTSLLRLALPYLPLLAALSAVVVSLERAPKTQASDLLLGLALVLIVLTRQFLAMVDNLRLVLAVQKARDQLQHQARHDVLTGLPNRVLFADRLDRAILEPSARVSVLFCDLDDFKAVNDTFGHEAGDTLLRTVAERLLACVRVTDTVTRLGGDEFAVLLSDSPDADEVARRILWSLKQPIDIDGNTISVSASIGVAHHHGPPTPPSERRGATSRPSPPPAGAAADAATMRAATAQLLLRAADTAMYAAKGAGKGRAVGAGPALTPAAEPAAVGVDVTHAATHRS